MAEALTFLAEEVGRAVALVWGGVGIAARLNYEVMSVVVAITTRMVQLLLLLLQKFANLFSILTHDTMFFLGDIGNGVLTVFSSICFFINSVCSCVAAIGTGIVTTCYRICSFIGLLHSSIVALLTYVLSQIVNAFYLLKCGFVLFGSAVLFGISFLPNLVCLLITSSVQLIVNFYFRLGLLVQDCWYAVDYIATNSYKSFSDFICDIPAHAMLGACIGVVLLVCFKLLVQYMIDNFVLVPDLPIPSFVTSMRRRLLNWYVRVWREANRPPTRENSTDEELVDDTSDDNGNDNNDNVPDRNLAHDGHLPDRRPPLPPISLPLFASHSSTNNSGRYTSASSSAFDVESRPSDDAYVVRRLGRPPLPRRSGVIGLAEDVTEDDVTKEVRLNKWVEGTEEASSEVIKKDALADQLYKELQDEREGKLCIICQDKPKSILLLPCRHICVCDSCRSAIITTTNSCPICRKNILDSLSVYLS